MKLNELAARRPAKQLAKVYESYFGKGIKFEHLTRGQANSMLKKVRGILGEARLSTGRHNSQQNPAYLKLMVMEQALTAKLSEMGVTVPTGQQPTATGAVPGTQTPAVAGAVAKDPKLAAALKKSSAGQTLNPEEQKLVAGAAMMQAESRLRRAMKRLNESEVQQAQVVLAAQDMVDKMQGMLEDVSELQFKELPALVDSIKNQVGVDQAAQFNQDATAALTGLLQNIQGAKQQLDAALGVVTGTGAPALPGAGMGADMAAAGADMGAADADMAAAGADMGAADAAAAGADLETGAEPAAGPGLGRARR
jgi:hypothetical protein